MMFPKQTIQLTTNGKPVKVHIVSTGAVSVKTKFRNARYKGLPAMIDFILDKTFTEWMPIWVMVIEHPEGIFVIDTGENSDINNPDYFNSSGIFAKWFDTTQFKFKVSREEEIDQQLIDLGIALTDVKAVVLTHLHLDHIDGLRHFPLTEIIVNKYEWENPFGDLPKLYPSWFKPTLIEINEQFDVFEKMQYLTKSKDLILVHTPGHTYGHCSVLLKADECNIFFAADVCYSQEQLIKKKYSGSNASYPLAKGSYDKVQAFAKKQKLVFIPSHDADAARRLNELEPLLLKN